MCPNCGSRSYEVLHCSGATPVKGRSYCHAEQCHMVTLCHGCERESTSGCAVPSHQGIGYGLTRTELR